jgi:hypothetical protein
MLLSSRQSATFQLDGPRLLVVVDTEEEFDWSQPHSRSSTSVDHIRHQNRAQSILERYGIRPIYVVDYPVASQEAAYRPLREWLADGKCLIGAHLHPWVNPPFEEEVSARNSYAGNLPAKLEREKLKRLTDVITSNFECRPTFYRAGRYGIGPATGDILEELGYEIDSSVVPFTDFHHDGGPDFSGFDAAPFWFGPSAGVLEIPLTVAWCGRLRTYASALQSRLLSDRGLQLHVPGVFARLRLLERIRLTPEGNSLAEMKRLTATMLRAGEQMFVLSYHSPSVVPGNTPYVRDGTALQRFLGVIDQFCEYFFGACGGTSISPDELRATCARRSD